MSYTRHWRCFCYPSFIRRKISNLPHKLVLNVGSEMALEDMFFLLRNINHNAVDSRSLSDEINWANHFGGSLHARSWQFLAAEYPTAAGRRLLSVDMAFYSGDVPCLITNRCIALALGWVLEIRDLLEQRLRISSCPRNNCATVEPLSAGTWHE